ncbi:MAG: PLP-dependent aminotransferase family protein [Proteobacteria bacterium]|nr:MAG: PLP-dependent aminotransferase family protein [Pseudomonadota bacterium]
MKPAFSDRINDVPRSFLREILKVAVSDDVISFAGGLPNRALFPAENIRDAANRVLSEEAGSALQYGSSEGFRPLREWIAERYRRREGLVVDPDDVLVTTGSQQGLDLLGKVLLNDGDAVAIEEPGYLGAIQAFSVYRPRFCPVAVEGRGVDVDAFAQTARRFKPRAFYTVPNFQNPSGVTCDDDRRRQVAALVDGSSMLLLEDDPYHELRFSGNERISYAHLAPGNTVLLGSFSKIVAPSFRVGWMVARKPLMEKLVVAKQAADLHTSEITQRILYRYLIDNDIDAHIDSIRRRYGAQCRAMLDSLAREFPDECRYTEPEGGMFLWLTLPEGVEAMTLFDRAIDKRVAFVPGAPFYTGRAATDTLRLNFSCVDESTIETGMGRLAEALATLRG